MSLEPENAYVIEVQSVDWIYVLGKLLKGYDVKSGDDVTAQIGELSTTYLIRRDLVPASEIARVIGTTAEMVEQADTITLAPLASEKGWQEPTVSYYGEA